jgi:hypothetical protein
MPLSLRRRYAALRLVNIAQAGRQPICSSIMYMMYRHAMATATLSDVRTRQAEYLDTAQREPVELLSRGARRKAIVVSPEFYDRAVAALEDAADVRGAALARAEPGSISHQALMAELGL